ncbi:hypothetical protein [Rhodoflexus sp.]
MKQLLLLSSIIAFFTACNSQGKEVEIDRQVRKKLALMGGSTVTDLKLTKEQQKNLYFADAVMENGMPIQAMVMMTDDTVALKETLNSVMLRRLSKELRIPCIGVMLKPAENGIVPNEFQGEALFKTGEKIQLYAHEQFGWRPAHDVETLRFLTKRQIERDIYGFADTLTLFNLDKTAVDTVYTGNFETQKGDKKEFSLTWSQTGFQWKLNSPRQ